MKEELEPFYQSLKTRGWNVKTLAGVIASSPSHLYQTFAGQRGAVCRRTRLRVMVWLTDCECELLGWNPQDRPKLPQGRLFYVEPKKEVAV
jgi:hypothetical protein